MDISQGTSMGVKKTPKFARKGLPPPPPKFSLDLKENYEHITINKSNKQQGATLINLPNSSTSMGKIYLGSATDAMNNDWLAEKNITCRVAILSLKDMEELTKGMDEQNKEKFCNGVNLKYFLLIRCADHSDSDIESEFLNTTRTIHNVLVQGDSVLVHCRMGVSRSATIVAAYLMQYYGMTAQGNNTVLEYIKQYRQNIGPNLGFCLALYKFEKAIKLYNQLPAEWFNMVEISPIIDTNSKQASQYIDEPQ